MSAPHRPDPPDLHHLGDLLDDLAVWCDSMLETLPPGADAEQVALSRMRTNARELARAVSGARAFYRIPSRDVR